MKHLLLFVTILLTTIALTACQQSSSTPSTASAPASQSPAPQTTNTISGTVVETIHAAGYTYVLVDDGQQQIWAATPQFHVSDGDLVVVPEGMPMHNYTSPSLNRDFELVYFVDSILNASSAEQAPDAVATGMPPGHPPIGAAPGVDLSGIEKVEDGLTIAEIYAAGKDLGSDEVRVRGKVVKFSPQIMGTNWIHLQDGSGDAAEGTHDLTVTSNDEVRVGDIVIASGAVTIDKDFGHGYFYSLIMESASLTAE